MTVLLCAALIFGLGGCSRAGKTVGKDVKKEDVTDFYYTVDSSTNPPSFRRYRFYVEDGVRFFFHEKREGSHWPLTEQDRTVSETVELTDEQWDAFFDCISGGTVKKRGEHTESGSAGPWLYLYWKNDRSKNQEYSFASHEKQTAFEALCLELAGTREN